MKKITYEDLLPYIEFINFADPIEFTTNTLCKHILGDASDCKGCPFDIGEDICGADDSNPNLDIEGITKQFQKSHPELFI